MELTAEHVRAEKAKEEKPPSLGHRTRGFLRSSRGWLRRKKVEEPGIEVPETVEPDTSPSADVTSDPASG